MMAPIEEPEMATGRMPNSSSASITQVWEIPRAPPPPKATANVGSPFDAIMPESGGASLLLIGLSRRLITEKMHACVAKEALFKRLEGGIHHWRHVGLFL